MKVAFKDDSFAFEFVAAAFEHRIRAAIFFDGVYDFP
jgi:hypothetical protein